MSARRIVNTRKLCGLARARLLLAAWIVTVAPLHAQTPARTTTPVAAHVVAEAAATMTGAAVTRHVGVLAHDSMYNRETPSAALERTARYIANELQKLGLKPGGDQNSWFQRYPLPGQRMVDYAESRLYLSIPEKRGKPEKELAIAFSAAAWLASPIVPEGSTTMPASAPLLVTGRPTAALLAKAVSRATQEGKAVFYIPPTDLDSLAVQQVIEQRALLSYGLVIVRNEDSIAFARRREVALRQQKPTVVNPGLIISPADSSWTAQVRLAAIENLFMEAGIDLARVRLDTMPRIHELPPFGVQLYVKADTTQPIVTAPNVIGVLKGSDPKLRYEHIVFSVRMDHRGTVDSTRGRNEGDNAFGIAGLIELARAFSRPEVRPRRSLVFLGVSGSTQDFWGSRYFVGKEPWRNYRGSMLNITVDLSGSQIGDALMVDGQGEVELAVQPAWVAAAHSELGLSVVDGGTAAPATADHISFVQQFTPSLHVYTNPPRASGQVVGVRRPLDAERVASVLRLLFYVGQELATAPLPPHRTATGRQQRQLLKGRP